VTTYRLFPDTSGPDSVVSYAGDFIAGVVFTVSGGVRWFEGYWWWVASVDQSTDPVKCALWSAYGGGSGFVVPGTVVTSGPLTAGQWNWIPISEPVQLAPGYDSNNSANGSAYIAAVGCNGDFPDTNNFWGNSGPGTGGIVSGPLIAYSGNMTGCTLEAPGELSQGVFSTGGADPSTTMPAGGSNVDNFWVDVQVSDTAPAEYAGSYRLWPNKIDANAATSGDDNVNYTIATEIHLTAPSTLDNVWYFSPLGATTLATRADVWDIATGQSVASITAPTWLTSDGSSYAPGDTAAGLVGTWIKAAFADGTILPSGQYRVSVYNAEGTTDDNWNPKDAATDYWGETYPGVGSSGLESGPLSAPGWSGAAAGYLYGGPGTANPPYSNGASSHAQPVFGMLPSGDVDFPQLFAPVGTGDNESQNYWVDLEVTPTTVSVPDTAIFL
jgi:hypothetical protein